MELSDLDTKSIWNWDWINYDLGSRDSSLTCRTLGYSGDSWILIWFRVWCSYLWCSCNKLINVCFVMGRGVVSCWISFDNCNSGANSTGFAFCIQRDGLDTRLLLLVCDGSCDLLCLLSHVTCAWFLWKVRPSPHPIPWTRFWCFR